MDNELLQRHSDSIDSIVSEFTDKFEILLEKSKRILTASLNDKLITDRGTVSASKANQKLISGLDDKFMGILDSFGYPQLLENFTESFNGQFVWFQDVLESINAELQYPLPFDKFGKSDMSEFSAYQISSADILRTSVENVAARAKQQAVLSAGGMPVKELTTYVSKTLDLSMGESETLAETSISSFYRTITDKGFQIIEDDLPGFEIRYSYEGPLDKITRPFCIKLEKLSRSGKTWTRLEIDKMRNGQLPNVFVTGGGYRCRHQWMISVRDLQQQQKDKGKPEKQKKQIERSSIEKDILAKRAVHVKNFKAKTGVDHPSEQLVAIKKGVEDLIQKKRK